MVATVVRCLVKEENSRIHWQKEYGDTYAKMVEPATKQMIANFRKFVNEWFSDEVTVEKIGLSSAERRDAVTGIPHTLTRVWLLPSMRRTFIPVEEMCFWTI